MTAVVFKLPRKHLPGVTPRAIARSILASAPRGTPEPEPTSPLDVWHPGFSREAAEAHLLGMGGSIPRRPGEDPGMPKDVTILTSSELGELFAAFTAQIEWLECQHALAEIDSAEYSAHSEHVEAEIHLRKSGTVSDKKSKTTNDPRFIEAEQRALVEKAKARLLKARVAGLERCAAALSREMTRRVPVGEAP